MELNHNIYKSHESALTIVDNDDQNSFFEDLLGNDNSVIANERTIEAATRDVL